MRALAGDIGLGDDQTVRKDRLLARFRRPLKRVTAGDRIDHRHNRFNVEDAAEGAVGCKRLKNRARIGQSAGLNGNAAEVGEFAPLTLDHHAAQRLLQIGARDAAQTAIAQQHGLIGTRSHQDVVNAGCAELVDDNRGSLALRCIEKTLEKRRLSSPQKAGDDNNRDPRPAFALEPAPEMSGGP